MIETATSREPVRYLGSAVITALVNNAVLIAADRAGFGYAGVLAWSWAITGSLGYLLHVRYTFRATRSLAGYARFMGGVALGIPLAFAAIWLFKSGLGWPMWAVAPAATLVMVIYNYLAARLAILRRLLRNGPDHG
ncbi:MAG: GtrA family protein [Proteobacteria bacterium]|nr:GtrA family protein [Pseudomonadota bacterium]